MSRNSPHLHPITYNAPGCFEIGFQKMGFHLACLQFASSIIKGNKMKAKLVHPGVESYKWRHQDPNWGKDWKPARMNILRSWLLNINLWLKYLASHKCTYINAGIYVSFWCIFYPDQTLLLHLNTYLIALNMQNWFSNRIQTTAWVLSCSVSLSAFAEQTFSEAFLHSCISAFLHFCTHIMKQFLDQL